MEKISEAKIIELATKAIQQIKESDNPYKNMSFVNKIFEGKDKNIIEDVKSILKEKYNGQLNENLFVENTLPAYKHLYNFLYENNLLSKYDLVAEYMNYPRASTLFEWGDAYHDDGTDADTIARWDAEQQAYDPSAEFGATLEEILQEIGELHLLDVNMDKALNHKVFSKDGYKLLLKKSTAQTEKAIKLFNIYFANDTKKPIGKLRIYLNKKGVPVRLIADTSGGAASLDLTQTAPKINPEDFDKLPF